jgi:hypothetical protein
MGKMEKSLSTIPTGSWPLNGIRRGKLVPLLYGGRLGRCPEYDRHMR